MVREYIGARYVPKFMGTYDNTQAYEALCVVDNGLGTSYISKVPTPAGTPLTDTDYWAVYGASSGAIINLQNQIDDMNDGNVSGSLQNQIDANTSDIAVLKTIPRERKFILIGDSYGYGISTGYTSDTGKGWIDHFVESVGNYCDVYVPDISLMPGVAGFASSLTFQSMIESLENTITDKNSITDIVVMGGANDLAWNSVTQSAIENAVKDFCEYCQTTYPNAHIKIGVLCARLRYMISDSAHPYEAYKTCTRYGAEFMDDALNLYISPTYVDPDHTHLTQSGYAHYKDNTNNLIICGHTNYSEMAFVDLTIDSTQIAIEDTQTTKFVLMIELDNSMIRLSIHNQANNSCSFRVLDRSISYGASLADVFTLDSWFDIPLYYEYCGGVLAIKDTTDGGTSYVGGCFRLFQNAEDKLTLQLSAPVGNWHVNDANYRMVALIDGSHICTIAI